MIHTRVRAHTAVLHTEIDLAEVTSPWTFVEHSRSNHSSFQYSCQFWPEKAALLWICSFVLSEWKYLWHLHWHAGDNPPCDCRTNWGSAALQTGERGEGHRGNVQSRASPFGSLPFQPLQPMVHLSFRALALSFSAHSCRASTGRKLYYGWVNLLINIQPLDPAFPRWPIKNYNWQRA